MVMSPTQSQESQVYSRSLLKDHSPEEEGWQQSHHVEQGVVRPSYD